MNRVALRLGHTASILAYLLCRLPGALAFGPVLIAFRRRYHLPLPGALFAGRATALDPGPRRWRRDAGPPAGARFFG